MLSCFHKKILKSCLSVYPYAYLKKRNHPSFVNISPTVVNDTWMEKSLRVLQQGNPRTLFSKKGLNWIFTCSYFYLCRSASEKRNHPGFINISLSVINDTSMERSSRVLHHGNPKHLIFFIKKVRNSILTWYTLAFHLSFNSVRGYNTSLLLP